MIDPNVQQLVLWGSGIYMLVMLGIGLWASKRVNKLSDFLVAGRSLPFYLALATLFATWFGGGTCMGASGATYSEGLLSAVADPYAAGCALILAGFFYVKLLRRLKLLTVTDVFGIYYGKNSEIFASLLMIPVYVGWLGSQMVALGLLINLLTGISPTLAIIIGSTIVLIYTYSGGMWAVTLTDFIQVIVLVLGLFALFPIVIHHVGGWTSFIESTPKESWNFFPIQTDYNTWTAYLGRWALMGLGVIVGQDLIQRSLASKNESVAKSSAIWAGVFYILVGSIPVILGIAGRQVFPDLANTELILPMLSIKFMHPLLLMLFVGALSSAIMSSADSALLAATSLITQNIVKRVIPEVSENSLLRIARISTVLITILSMAVALYVKEIYDLMIQSWATLLVAILVPVTAALYWKKANTLATWFSMLTGISVWLGYTLFQTKYFLNTPDTAYSQGALYGGVASLLSYVLVTFVRYSKIEDIVPARLVPQEK